MAKIKQIVDDEQLIKSLELAVNCIKRANDFPNQRHSWLSIARGQITRSTFFMDDELEYAEEKIDRNVAAQLKRTEKKIPCA